MSVNRGKMLRLFCGGKAYVFNLGENPEKGGNGEVFFSEPEGLALKRLYRNGKTRISRFEREIDCQREIYEHCVATSQRPAAVPILTVSLDGEPNQFKFTVEDKEAYVMPRCEPIDDKVPFTGDELLNLLFEVAEDLSVVHSLKLAHRDIKKNNVLRYKGHWVLADFGLVFSPSNSKRDTRSGDRVGPSIGCPPELEYVSPTSGIEDYRPSDIYLFGKLVWQMVTGESHYYEGPFYLHSKPSSLFIQRAREHYPDLPLIPLLNLMELSVIDSMEKRCSLGLIMSRIQQAQQMLGSENESGRQNDAIAGKIFGIDIFPLANSFVVEGEETMDTLLNKLAGNGVFALSQRGQDSSQIKGYLLQKKSYCEIRDGGKSYLFSATRIVLKRQMTAQGTETSVVIRTDASVHGMAALPDFYSLEAQHPEIKAVGLYSLDIWLSVHSHGL